jgi:hypothetical protein
MDGPAFQQILQTSAHFSQTSKVTSSDELHKRATILASCDCKVFGSLQEASAQLRNAAILLDFKERTSLPLPVRVAQDLLSFPARTFYAFGKQCCAKCYDAAHGMSHYGRDEANKFLRSLEKGQELSLDCLAEDTSGRAPLLFAVSEQYLQAEFAKRAHITSRDGAKILPSRPRVTHLFAQFSAERERLKLASISLPTFRRAFNSEIVKWKCPRYHLECKACKTCWLLDRQIHLADSKGQAELSGSLRRDLEFHVTTAYQERLVYYLDRENAAKGESNCLIADFTYCVTIPYLQQRTSIKDELDKLLVGFGCVIDHGVGGGKKLFFNLFCGGKDDTQSVFSMLFFQLDRMKDRLRDKVLNLQLDSASSNKSLHALVIGGWMCLHFGCKSLFFNYLVAGHTGEDVDGATAAPRIAIRADGDVFSWAGVLKRVETAFAKSTERKPEIVQCLDLEKGRQWEATEFNKRFQHFMLDFSFLDDVAVKIAGFTQKNVQRPEFSVHSIQFLPSNQQVSISVKRLRSMDSSPWSEAVPLFRTPLSPELINKIPGKIFWGDKKHALSKGVDIEACKDVLLGKTAELQTSEDVAFNRSLFDEVGMCVIRNENEPKRKGKSGRKQRERRNVAIEEPIVLHVAGQGRKRVRTVSKVAEPADEEDESSANSADEGSDEGSEGIDEENDEEDSEEKRGLTELKGNCERCQKVSLAISSLSNPQQKSSQSWFGVFG